MLIIQIALGILLVPVLLIGLGLLFTVAGLLFDIVTFPIKALLKVIFGSL